MTPAQFRHRLAAHGPALEQWPDADRDAARLLLVRSARARRRLLAALAHDQSLDAPVDPAILARLAAGTRIRVARAPRTTRPRPPAIIVPLQCSALAACALLGIWLGRPDRQAAYPPGPAMLASMQITALDPPWPDAGR